MSSLHRRTFCTSTVGQLSENLNNPSYLQLKDLTFLKDQHCFFADDGDGVLFCFLCVCVCVQRSAAARRNPEHNVFHDYV